MLLGAFTLDCGGATQHAEPAPQEPRTRGSKSDSASVRPDPAAEADPPGPRAEEEFASRPGEGPSNQGDTGSESASPPLELAERYRTQHEAPAGRVWLVIRNTYLETQYVFLGGELLGWVPEGTVGSFDIPPGAHSITISDSRDGRSNAQSLSEVFDAGYSYHYDVVVR